MKVSLVLIVWNELPGCQIDISRLAIDVFDEVFAVDGGSTDGTVDCLEKAGIPVYRQTKPGLNAAYVLANAIASGDAVVAFFPKGPLPTEDLHKFRPLFQKGYDLVIASRHIAGSVNEEDAKFWRPRKFAVWCLSVMAAVIWRREGVWVRDVLHGFKGWRKSAFNQMRLRDEGLSIDIEMVVRAYKLRLSRIEFATRERRRGYGSTHFKIWPTGKQLLAYLWHEIRRPD